MRKINITLIFLLALGISVAPHVQAQIRDNAGKEFFMGFLPNLNPPSTELHLTGDVATDVTVEYPVNSPTFSTTVSIVPGTVTIVTLPSNTAQGWTAGTVQNNAVRAFADEEFVAYMVNRATATSDAALALPTDVLNTDYIVASFFSTIVGSDRSEFAVIAAFDNTTVTITPTASLVGGFAAGVPFDITLNKGEGFLGMGTTFGPLGDLTGTIIEADKPIAMTNGNRCTNVPPNITFCDHIFEVAQPVQTWGNGALVAPLPNRTNGSVYRIIASEDNTTVEQDGAPIGTIDRGQFIETAVLPDAHLFDADKPIFVIQYMTGDSFPGATLGDPAMGNMIPPEQYLQGYTFSTVGGNQFVQNFVSIIAEDTDVIGNTILLDGAPIPAVDFTSIPGTGFSFSVQPLSSGSHTTSSNGFHGITVEGYNNFDSYIYPGGALFAFINPRGDANPPICDVIVTDNTATGTATDNRPSEDVNNNGVLDPGEDLNNNGQIDEDTGIFFVELENSVNLQIAVASFVPGVPSVTYTVTLIDPTSDGTGTVVVTDGVGNTCKQPIEINVTPTVLESCDDLLISNYQTAPASDQFVEIANVGSDPISIDNCSVVGYDVFTETSIGDATVGLSGVLNPGGTIVVGFDGQLPSPGPGALGIFNLPPPPDGTPIGNILDEDITGMVYLNNNMVFGISHLTVPEHNAIYECIYGGSGTGPFTGPFASLGDCLGSE